MKRYPFMSTGVLFLLAFLFALPNVSHAQEVELEEGMTQGDFALWLVKAIGAQSKLPPAAQAEDAIKFLTELGSIPEEGWQKDEPMTAELLAGLLEDPGEGKDLSWEELVDEVRKQIQEIFDERKLGVFRVFSATPSVPAV